MEAGDRGRLRYGSRGELRKNVPDNGAGNGKAARFSPWRLSFLDDSDAAAVLTSEH